MENWWCEQNPESYACDRKTFHHMEPEARKNASIAHRNTIREDPENMAKARKDIDDMHRAWCKHEGPVGTGGLRFATKGGLESRPCKAWMWTREISKDEL